MKPLLDLAVPVLVAASMAIVGLGLTAVDFRRVFRQPRLVVAAQLAAAALFRSVRMVDLDLTAEASRS